MSCRINKNRLSQALEHLISFPSLSSLPLLSLSPSFSCSLRLSCSLVPLVLDSCIPLAIAWPSTGSADIEALETWVPFQADADKNHSDSATHLCHPLTKHVRSYDPCVIPGFLTFWCALFLRVRKIRR